MPGIAKVSCFGFLNLKEMAVNFIIEFYRPRTSRSRVRILRCFWRSLLFLLWRDAQIFADALDYQFPASGNLVV